MCYAPIFEVLSLYALLHEVSREINKILNSCNMEQIGLLETVQIDEKIFQKKDLTFIVRTNIINVRTIKEVRDVPKERTTV